jgi:ribosomal protein S18 acetylase RimI-like enzyme
MKVIIRKAKIGDEKQVVDVNIKVWESTYKDFFDESVFERKRQNRAKSEEWWKEHLKGECYAFVAETQGKVVGYIDIFQATRNEKFADCGEVGSIYILDEFHRQGIGRKLFEKAFECIKKEKFMLNVLKGNPALFFYEKLGGKIVDEIEFEKSGKIFKEYVLLFEKSNNH